MRNVVVLAKLLYFAFVCGWVGAAEGDTAKLLGPRSSIIGGLFDICRLY